MGKHAATRFQTYQETNDNQIQRLLREGFALGETLRFKKTSERSIAQRGTIVCQGGIVLEVKKVLKILRGHGANAFVQTVEYHYEAYAEGRGSLLRYRSPDGFRTFPHVHRFDLFKTWSETAVHDLRTEDEIPTVAEVVDELRDLYYENLEEF